MDRDRETEPHIHARRVCLDGRVDELLELGKVHDVVEAVVDLLFRQAEHDAVDDDVLAPRDLGVKTSAELDERGDTAVDDDRSSARLRDARDTFEQRALPGAVSSDDGKCSPFADVEGDVVQGFEALVGSKLRDQASAEKRALERTELLPLAVALIDFG